MRHHNPLRQRGIGPSTYVSGWDLLDKDLWQSMQVSSERSTIRESPRSTVGLRGMAKWPAGTQPKTKSRRTTSQQKQTSKRNMSRRIAISAIFSHGTRLFLGFTFFAYIQF